MPAPQLYQSILECIGNTPMLHLQRLSPTTGASVYAKLESHNPGGSIKDRTALAMVLAAEKEGLLRHGDTILEPTSGNTGLGLAMVSAARGYHAVLVTPKHSRAIRRDTIKQLGAEVIEVETDMGMQQVIEASEQLAAQRGNVFRPMQFQNPANPEIHEHTTAAEIVEAFEGKVPDVIVAGAGTGGTLTGIARYCKRLRPDCKIVAVQPTQDDCIEGIGVGFVPQVFETSLVDETILVSAAEAEATRTALAQREGVLVGPSSGAALHAALSVAATLQPSQTVVVMLTDTGERYFRPQGAR